MGIPKREEIHDDNIEPETIEKTINDNGERVWRFNCGTLKVTATYRNEPSDEAIQNSKRLYNELFYEFNK